MNSENRKSRTLEKISYGLAGVAVIIGLASVFKADFICKAHDKALLWFAFALLAILIPYIREITFKDLKVVIDKINTASQNLDGAAITVKELNNRLNATRDELIDGYQELLRSLPEEERKKRVIRLSRLYLQEMGMDVTTVKKWLIEVGYPITNLDETMDDEYLTALRSTQQANCLGDDGIFGYRTLNLLNQLRTRPDNNKT
jgi:putative peptidoglycan binding protein